MSPTPVEVLRMLSGGHTVAWVMDATGWPRRSVVKVAAANHLLVHPATDLAYAPRDDLPDDDDDPTADARPGAGPAPPGLGRCSHAALLAWAAGRGTPTAKNAATRIEKALAVIAAQQRRETEREQAKAERERAREQAKAERERAREQAEHLELELAKARAAMHGRTFDEAAWLAARDRARAIGAVNLTRRRSPGTGGPTDYDPRTVRTWALATGLDCPTRGRYLPRPIVQAWRESHHQDVAS